MGENRDRAKYGQKGLPQAKEKQVDHPAWNAYRMHKVHAKERGIEWLFTFDTWLDTWMRSGRWEQRGRGKGKYVMSRPADSGPYSPGNVRIVTHEENSSERASTRPRGPGHPAAGSGRGWVFDNRSKVRPYLVRCRHKYVGVFATIEEAELAYQEAARKGAPMSPDTNPRRDEASCN